MHTKMQVSSSDPVQNHPPTRPNKLKPPLRTPAPQNPFPKPKPTDQKKNTHTHTSVIVTVRMGLLGSFGRVLKGPAAKSSIIPFVSPCASAEVPVTRAICCLLLLLLLF